MTDSTQSGEGSEAVAFTARKQLLGELNLSPAAFEAFLQEPYQAVMEAVGAAVRGYPSHEFMGRPQISVPELEAIVTDTASPHQLAARRLIADRIMSLYLLRAFSAMTDQECGERLEIVGLEHLHAAMAEGRGVMLLNSHFGPGRLIPIILAKLGWELAHVSPINEVAILDLQLPGKIEHIELGPAFDLRILATMRARLLEGKIVHGTGDGMRGNAVMARPFLGKPRRFPQSFGFLSLSTGAACLPVFIRSDEFGAIRMEICPALQTGDPSLPAEDRIAGMIDGYSAELEKRWLTDYGNVPPHSLQLYQRGFPGLSGRKG